MYKQLPTQPQRDRFIELACQFGTLYAQLRDCRNLNERPALLKEMCSVITEADDLVQRYHEDFGDWSRAN